MEKGVTRYSPKRLYFRCVDFLKRKLNPDWPWWSEGAINLINMLIGKNDVVLEIGSGRSTIWLAKRCARVISIENSSLWYERVAGWVHKEGLEKKVSLFFAPVKKSADCQQQPYLLPLKHIEPDTIDIAIIDGKLRGDATAVSLPLIKTGGLLVVDDANRYFPMSFFQKDDADAEPFQIPPEWEHVYKEISRWRKIWSASDGKYTAIFFKP